MLRASATPGERAVGAMIDAIGHRGPDDRQTWMRRRRRASRSATCGSAIVDLTAAGRQPMVSHDGRYVLVYNGEIYNHAEIA